jgi:drug/metabolite transporter, DME family
MVASPSVSGTVAALALTSALLSALATILISIGLRRYGPYTGFWINLLVGTLGLWLAVAVTGGPGHPSAWSLGIFMLAGLIGTVVGRLLRFMSIETVGPSISAALVNLNPLVSTGLAVLLLGERVTGPLLAGTVITVAGTTLLSLGGRSVGVRPAALLLPLGSACCFGLVAVLRKVALDGAGVIIGTAANVTTAFVAFTAFLLASRQGGAMACRGRSLVYFVGAGIAENLGVFLVLVALGWGAVSVVAPLASIAPIFVLLLSLLFLRGIEILNTRLVLGTVLIVAGVYLITALR